MVDPVSASFTSSWITWVRESMTSLVVGSLIGITLLGIRLVLFGWDDPFLAGWPIYLQSMSMLTAVILGLILRHPFSVALGIYLGFLLYAYFFANWEYPMATAIAFAIHGFAPALVGAIIALLWIKLSMPSVR